MKKTHLEKVEVDKDVLDDVICNKCGESCKDSSNMNYEGLLEVSVEGGYASKLGDSVRYTFSLCENCLEELFKSFKINPFKRYGMFSGGDPNERYDDDEETNEQ